METVTCSRAGGSALFALGSRTALTLGACSHQCSTVLLDAAAAATLLRAALSLATLIGVAARTPPWAGGAPIRWLGLLSSCALRLVTGREAWVGELLDDD